MGKKEYTVKEAVEKTSVPEETIRNWCRSGLVQHGIRFTGGGPINRRGGGSTRKIFFYDRGIKSIERCKKRYIFGKEGWWHGE